MIGTHAHEQVFLARFPFCFKMCVGRMCLWGMGVCGCGGGGGGHVGVADHEWGMRGRKRVGGGSG